MCEDISHCLVWQFYHTSSDRKRDISYPNMPAKGRGHRKTVLLPVCLGGKGEREASGALLDFFAVSFELHETHSFPRTFVLRLLWCWGSIFRILWASLARWRIILNGLYVNIVIRCSKKEEEGIESNSELGWEKNKGGMATSSLLATHLHTRVIYSSHFFCERRRRSDSQRDPWIKFRFEIGAAPRLRSEFRIESEVKYQ